MDNERNIEAQDAQIGVVGDHAHVEGGIHFHRQTIICEGVRPVSAGDLLDACQAQVKSVLYDARHKYTPELYVNRAIEEDLNAFFGTPLDGPGPNCFLLVAQAGSGKTNLLCDLARVRASRQPVLLLMGGSTYISGSTGLLGAIKEELEIANSAVAFRSAGDSLHTLHRLAEEMEHDALLLLDAINEHDHPVAMRQALEDLLRKTRGQRVKLVVTCRDYYWGLFKGEFWEGATVNELPAEDDTRKDDGEGEDFSHFAAGEHERALDLYLEHYNITGRPVGDAAEQCRHPLLLRFFCEAYRGQDIGEVEDIRLKELFDQYWEQKLVSIAERMIKQGDERMQGGLAQEVGGYLLNVAGYMLHNNVRAVPLAEMSQAAQRTEQYNDPRSVYGRIRDEFIILEERERGKGQRDMSQVAFVYEEFMEYVMARSLLRDWDREGLDERAILEAVEDLTHKYEEFAQLLGVMVYLALILKDERDVALWSLLLAQGERWQAVVFEAFRKLPEDKLDGGVFDTLEHMLRTGDDDVQKQVLDLLKLERVGVTAAISPPLVDLVSKLAKHDEVSIARRAVLVLGHLQSHTVIPILIESLHHKYRTIRDNAVAALARTDQVPVEQIAEALKSDSQGVRISAVELLGKLGGAQTIKPLIVALRDKDDMVRYYAKEALVSLGSVAVAPLIDALENEDVRREVADVLGRLGKPAVDPLIRVFQGGDWDLQRVAAETLAKLGWEPSDEKLMALYLVARGEFEASTALGDVAINPLTYVFQYGSWYTKEQVALALRQLGWEPPNEELMALYLAAGEEYQACATLGEVAVCPLVEALKHGNVEAAAALRQLRDLRAVEPLIELLNSYDEYVREAAAKLLGELNDARAVNPLIEIFECENNRRVREAVLEALGELRDVRAMEPLIEALGGDNWEIAVDALVKLGETALTPLIEVLSDSDWCMRVAAAEALGQLGNVRAVDPLIEALKDDNEDVHYSAIEALRNLGTPEALAAVKEYEDDQGMTRQ